MSVEKTLIAEVPSPTERRRLKLELVGSGIRVSWSSGNDSFQQAFRIDYQVKPRWFTPISQKYPDSSEMRRSDVGIPVWIYRFILGFELDELRAAVEREGE